MRKKIIAGNWKMNIKPSETAALVKGVVEATPDMADDATDSARSYLKSDAEPA